MDVMTIRRKILLAGGEKPSRLPAGYREVEFIAAKNACPYIDMGFTTSADFEAEIHYKNQKAEAFLFGYRKGLSNNLRLFCNYNIEVTGTHTRFDWGVRHRGGDEEKFPLHTGDLLFTFHNKIGKLVNLSSEYSSSQSYSSIPPFSGKTGNMYLFAVNTGGTASLGVTTGTLAIYSAKFWVGGEPIRDYVPCVRKSDSVAGMYDLVSEQFYTDYNTPFVTEL